MTVAQENTLFLTPAGVNEEKVGEVLEHKPFFLEEASCGIENTAENMPSVCS